MVVKKQHQSYAVQPPADQRTNAVKTTGPFTELKVRDAPHAGEKDGPFTTPPSDARRTKRNVPAKN